VRNPEPGSDHFPSDPNHPMRPATKANAGRKTLAMHMTSTKTLCIPLLAGATAFSACIIVSDDDDPVAQDTDTPADTDPGTTGDEAPPTCIEERPSMEACVEISDGAFFDDGATLDEPCYVLTGPEPGFPRPYAVKNGTLTILPGTTLFFGARAGIEVEEGGVFSAVGTAEAPICLYGAQEQRGYWRGLRFEDAPGDSRLEHVLLDGGGSDPWTERQQRRNQGGISVLGEETRLTVTDSVFRNNDHVGIVVMGAVDAPISIASSRFESNALPVWLSAQQIPNLATDLVIEGNDADVIVLESVGTGGTHVVTSDAHWPRFDVPYRVYKHIIIEGAVSIEPGARFEFSDLGGIWVGGSLTAEGTADAPIVFEGVEPMAGAWRGIYFRRTTSDANRLAHVEVHHAGSYQWAGGRESSRGNVVLEHASSDCSDKAALTIDNALITQSANHGVAIRWGSLVLGCSNVVFEDIAGDDVFDESTEESEGGGCWCSSGDCECQGS
jgi:hypothetical protein